jgi:hypothetical protein
VSTPPPDPKWQMIDWTFGSTDTPLKFAETDAGFYIQPTKRHYAAQFEDFFGFGCGNYGYDQTRTIYIPKY